MTEAASDTRSVVVERDFPHPPDRVWRALTQPQLIAEWLMKNDFRPAVGHRFHLLGDWGTVACRVLEVEANRTLAYSWDANGLESVVTWTLAPSAAGTRLRMEQSGFRSDQEPFYRGAAAGWPRFLASLEQTLARMD
jgi:uncharacterized protein YndB with AHSA1/START domain